MSKTKYAGLWLLAFSLCLCPTLAAAANLRLGTGETAIATVLQYVAAPFEKSTGTKIDALKVGSAKGFLELVKNNVVATTADATLEELMAKAKTEGVDPGSPAQFRVSTLAKFRLTAVVHKDNPVAKLSKEQLVAVFSGKAANWKDVGGPDLPILPVWNKLSEGANYLFTKAILEKTPLSADRMEVVKNEEVRQTVASNPEGIGVLPVGMIDASVKVVEIPEVSKEILLITKGEPTPEAKKFLQFVQGEGKKYLN